MWRGTQQRGRLNDVDRADLTLRRAAEGTKFERLTTEVGEILGRPPSFPLSLRQTDRHDRWVDARSVESAFTLLGTIRN